jgi:hypothetical protein
MIGEIMLSLLMALPALFGGPLAPKTLFIRVPQSRAIDTTLVRRELAALLNVVGSREESSIRIVMSNLPLHPGVLLYTGLLPGAHGGPARGVVGATSDGVVLPVGCPATRRVLQALAPPILADSSLLRYAVVLAQLDGLLPSGGELISDPRTVPEWARTQAAERRLALVSPKVQALGNPVRARRVSVMVMAEDALYLVVVRVGPERFLDTVEDVTELASSRVG